MGVLAVLYAVLFGYLYVSADELPARVATHFGASGAPDGWMERERHLTWMAVFGVLFPWFVVGLSFATRYLPGSMLNVLNREYWTAPERRKETYDFLFRHSLWFACLGVGFVIALQWMIVEANKSVPAVLSMGHLGAVAGLFLAGVAWWVVMLMRRFLKARFLEEPRMDTNRL